MQMSKIVVHTDVFIDHLLGTHVPSVLRIALSKYFCYTTVFQATELFAIARTQRELSAIADSMSAVKLLGLNARNAMKFGELVATYKRKSRWNIMIAGLCLESKLPLLTNRGREFSGIRGLRIVPAHSLRKD